MSAIDVSYEVTGSGPPLYMVHGIGSRKVGWSLLLPHLKERFTCVTYDLRGHGKSPVPPPPYTLAELVEDLEALRATLGHESIHVIGHSLGGMIGPAYARKFPHRVRTVGLLSTAAGRTSQDRAKLAAVREAMQKNGIAATMDTLVGRWYTDEFVEQNPAAVATRIEQVVGTPEAVFLSVFQIYAETEMGPWLHEIKCPCLVLTGENDGGCNPRINQFIADTLPNAELIILERFKHSILMEAPTEVAQHVSAFLSKHRD